MNRRHLRTGRVLLMAGLMALAVGIYALAHPHGAQAVASYLTAARAQYPNIKSTALDSCALCHPSGGYSLNPYAQDYANHSHSYTAIENLDSDKDGFTNLAEITALTQPGDAASHPGTAVTPPPTAQPSPPPASTNTPVPPPSSTVTPVPVTPPPAPTAIPAPSKKRIMFTGTVEDLPDGNGAAGTWKIQGRSMRVTASTWIENYQGLGEHALVWVLGTRRLDGIADAQYIRVLKAGVDDDSAVQPDGADAGPGSDAQPQSAQ